MTSDLSYARLCCALQVCTVHMTIQLDYIWTVSAILYKKCGYWKCYNRHRIEFTEGHWLSLSQATIYTVHTNSIYSNAFQFAIHLTNWFSFSKNRTVRFAHNLLESVCRVCQLSVLSILASVIHLVLFPGMCTRPFRPRPRQDPKCIGPRRDRDVWWKPFSTTKYGSVN